MSAVNWNELKGKKVQFAATGSIYRGATIYQPMLYLPVTFLRTIATRLIVAKDLFTSDIDEWIDNNLDQLPEQMQTMIMAFATQIRGLKQIFPGYADDLLKLPLSITNCTLDEFEYLANESMAGTDISYIAKNKSSLVDEFLSDEYELTTAFGVNDDIVGDNNKYGIISMDLSWITLYSTNVVQIYAWDLNSLKTRFRRDDYPDLDDIEFEELWDQMKDTVISKKEHIENLIDEDILYYIHSNDLCDMFITETSIYFYGINERAKAIMGNLGNIDMSNVNLGDILNQVADSLEIILTSLYMFTMLNQGFFDGTISNQNYVDPVLGVNPKGHLNLMDLIQNVDKNSLGVQMAVESGITNEIPISGGGSSSSASATEDIVGETEVEAVNEYMHTWIDSYFDGYLHFYDGTNYGAGADGSAIYPIPVDHPYSIDDVTYNSDGEDGGLALSEAMVAAKRDHHGLYLADGTEVMWVPKFYGWSGSANHGIEDGRDPWTYAEVLESAADTTEWYTTNPVA